MILTPADLQRLRRYADDDALQQAAEMGARKAVRAMKASGKAKHCLRRIAAGKSYLHGAVEELEALELVAVTNGHPVVTLLGAVVETEGR